MLALLRERRSLAKRIADCKHASGAPIRNRSRELVVVSELEDIEPYDYRFLSLLFELTILEENAEGSTSTGVVPESALTHALSGSYEALSFIAGIVTSGSGVEFASEIKNHSLFQGVSSRGGHIINEGGKSGQESFRIVAREEQLVEVNKDGTMLIFRKPIGNALPRTVREAQLL